MWYQLSSLAVFKVAALPLWQLFTSPEGELLMQITKTRLKKIIKEETLKEVHPTVNDPLEFVQAALGALGKLNQLIDDVGDDAIDPTLRETLKAHIATASRHLEAASEPMMPGETRADTRSDSVGPRRRGASSRERQDDAAVRYWLDNQ